MTPRLIGELDFCAILAGQEWKSQIKQQVLQQQSSAAAQHLGEQSDPPASSSSETPIDAANQPISAGTFQLAQVPKITKIACGPSYSAAISSSGHVYVWGSK